MNYIARDTDDDFKAKVEDYILEGLNELAKYFFVAGDGLQLWLDMKNYFSDAYHQLLTILDDSIRTEAEFEIG